MGDQDLDGPTVGDLGEITVERTFPCTRGVSEDGLCV